MQDRVATGSDTSGQHQGGVLGGAQDATQVSPKKRRKRIRSPHPGVKLVCRDRQAGEVWLARWRDALTGRPCEQSLTRLGLTTAEARKAWAIRKAHELADVRAQVSLGHVATTDLSVQSAVAEYISSVGHRCKPSTLRNYLESINVFAAWVTQNGLKHIAELNRTLLAHFHDYWNSQLARSPQKGKKIGKGKKLISSRARSAQSINKGIRSLRTMVTWWRKRGYLPLLNSDIISDTMPSKTKRPMPNFLSLDQVKQLLDACKRHDAETFKITRLEHDGITKVGTTPRYAPATKFVLVMLLSGMRLTETSTLKWSSIQWESEQIVLSEDDTKTGHARSIDLRITPTLLQMLKLMKLSAGESTFVFGRTSAPSKTLWDATKKRLRAEYGAPKFTWHDLRRTCQTYLVCAPGIYGGASASLAAFRAGHSVQVAERHYTGLVRNISRDATTLEQALGIEALMKDLLRDCGVSNETMVFPNPPDTPTYENGDLNEIQRRIG